MQATNENANHDIDLRRHNRQDVLEYLMRRFGDDVLSLAYFYLQDRQMAEDAAQEVFIRVYDKLNDFRGDCSYFTWIYRITVNLCRDRLRSRHFRGFIPGGQRPATCETSDPEELVLNKLAADNILQAVLSLPAKYREVVFLKYYHELSSAEIARICGISENNVRVRLHRAYQALKEKLGTEGVLEK